MADDPDLDSAYALETPDDNKRLYARWAETYDADFVAATGFRFPALIAAEYIGRGGGWPCLDVGCGTGALAERLPSDAVVDGLDLTPEMLEVARGKGLYRALIEADVTQPLDIADGTYAGLISSGAFTHGHVGGSALVELVRVLTAGALGVISVKPEIWDSHGFGDVFDALQVDGLISAPETVTEAIYADGRAPEGHEADAGLIVTFRRL